MRRFLGLFFLLSSLSAVSQNDFRAGFIINHQQDTISGYIDYRGNKTNSEKCFFKSELDSEDKITYTPQEIQSYRFIDSKYYVAQRVETKEGSKMVFTEYLIDGIVDFYYYFDSEGEHYLINSDGSLRELKNEERKVYKNYDTYFHMSKEYVGLLKYSFYESPTLMRRAETTSLNHKSLIEIANQYHTEVCSEEECIIYEKKVQKTRVNIGPLVGTQMVFLRSGDDFPTDRRYLNQNTYSSTRPSFLGGLFVRFGMPSVDERLFVQYELSYQRWSATGVNVYYNKIYDIDWQNEITFQNSLVSNAIALRFHFPKPRLKPVLMIGSFVDYYLDQDYYRLSTVYDHNNGSESDREASYNRGKIDLVGKEKKINLGLTFGGGVFWKTNKNWELHADLKYRFGAIYYESMFSNQVMVTVGMGLVKGK
ncbi:PorT family protein [Reichenbachiella agariperforans]|uniref:PorT family protein n=1 Tax=Reichenbachiella agariperforans TaxID=156994 RepID=UPI001C0A1BCE|nr:PorT family protein [Reichenbachiella agariperforans]MBU2915944.1 PorT family protein [Reichenbachiella agariperforans]